MGFYVFKNDNQAKGWWKDLENAEANADETTTIVESDFFGELVKLEGGKIVDSSELQSEWDYEQALRTVIIGVKETKQKITELLALTPDMDEFYTARQPYLDYITALESVDCNNPVWPVHPDEE